MIVVYEDVLNKVRLDHSDIMLLNPAIVAKKLEKGGVPKNSVPKVQQELMKEVLSSDFFETDIIGGLKQPASDALKILITARLANSGELKPTIGKIADLSKLSRNKISPLVEALELCDLVATKSYRREQRVFPTAVADLYIDIISGNLKREYSSIKKTIKNIKSNKFTEKSLPFFEDLEAAFRVSKSAYEPNTMNYEIMKELHNKAMKLLVEAREQKIKLEDFEEFSNIILEISKIKEKAKKLGLKPVILEKTKKKFGRATVYRVKE